MVINRDDVLRLADALDDGGALYECGGQVIYGWRIGDQECPTSEAADMLILMIDEIERLRGCHEAR